MSMEAELSSDNEIRRALEGAQVIAVLGAHSEASRPAFYVPDYLKGQGYRIVPVNPRLVGTSLWGEPVLASLTEIGAPVDIVDVFRASAALPDHVEEILAMTPRPRLVWLQLGIRHAEVALTLRKAGIQVVQDRCTLADHRRMGIAPVTP